MRMEGEGKEEMDVEAKGAIITEVRRQTERKKGFNDTSGRVGGVGSERGQVKGREERGREREKS